MAKRACAWLLPALVAVAVASSGCTGTVDGSGSLAGGAAPAPRSLVPDRGGGGAAAQPQRPARVDCPGRTVGTSGRTPAQAILRSSPHGLSLVEANSGALSLERLLADNYPDTDQARDVFRAAGYVGGFQNWWASGSAGRSDARLELVSIYQFADPAGACALLGWETAFYELEPRPQVGLPGVMGYDVPEGEFGGSELIVTKGSFVIAVLVLHGAGGNLTRPAAQMLVAQYQSL